MRGFGLLLLLGVACSVSTTNDPMDGAPLAQAGAEAGGSAGDPQSDVAGAEPAMAGSGDGEAAGAAGGDEQGPGGAAGAASGQAGAHAQGGAGGKSSGGAGGSAGLGGSVGGHATGGSGSAGQVASAGQGGGPNQCSGFTAYTVDVNTCLAVTGDFQQQTDIACSPAGIISRDHCTTCTSWSSPKPLVVMLSIAAGATVKRYDTVGGVCPSNCKYICN